MTTRIRRYVETDTGHRVPNHKSKCRHMHGHRYRFEAEIEGDVVQDTGVSEEGMLMDFSQHPLLGQNFYHSIQPTQHRYNRAGENDDQNHQSIQHTMIDPAQHRHILIHHPIVDVS